LLKSPECDKKIYRSNIQIFNTVKIFRTTLFFRASASCSKILNDKKYVFNTVKKFRDRCLFQGKRKLLENLESKSVPTTVKIFRANSVKRKLLKNPQAQVAQKS